MFDELIEKIPEGDTRALARACRLVDERDARRYELLKRLAQPTRYARVLGITGNPGSGKSTLVAQCVEQLRAQEKKVAVLAVDPTSPLSGGAILGDRIRMQQHFLDEGVFIRSIATRGQLGGLSASAMELIRILDAARFDVIIVETVGVGQDELDVADIVDTTVVVMAPGLGDDVQTMKAGVIEIADIFVVNKADRPGADLTVQDLQQMIALSKTKPAPAGQGHTAANVRLSASDAGLNADGSWSVPVLKTIASNGEGIAELLDSSELHQRYLAQSEAGIQKQTRRRQAELMFALETLWRERLHQSQGDRIQAAQAKLESQAADPYLLLEELVEAWDAKA